MASVTTLEVPILRRWREERWPASAPPRWALRAGLSLPFVALAALAISAGVTSTANLTLTHQADLVTSNTGPFAWLKNAYPPIPVAVAALVGTVGGLSVVGALCAGTAIQVSMERLVLRSYRMPAVTLFLVGTAGTPVFWFLATQDLTGFLSLIFLSVALTGLLDFVYHRATQSGSIAGLTFGLAALCSLAGAAFALTGALAALLIGGPDRVTRRREPAVGEATLALILFPAIAAITGWLFLQWRFTGTLTASFSSEAPAIGHFAGGVSSALWHAVRSTGIDVGLTPLLIAGTVILARRRPLSAAAALLPIATLVLIRWMGIPFGNPASLVLLEVVALTVLPEAPSRSEWTLLGTAALSQLGLLCAYSATSLQISPWITHLG